jgi:hypothetical protein
LTYHERPIRILEKDVHLTRRQKNQHVQGLVE